MQIIIFISAKTESIYYNKIVITVCKQIKGKNLRLLISSDFKMFSSFLSLFYFFNLIGNEIFRLRVVLSGKLQFKCRFCAVKKKKKIGHKNIKEKVKSIICLIGCTNNQYDKPVRYINGHSCYCGGLHHSLLVCFYKNLLLLGK